MGAKLRIISKTFIILFPFTMKFIQQNERILAGAMMLILV